MSKTMSTHLQNSRDKTSYGLIIAMELHGPLYHGMIYHELVLGLTVANNLVYKIYFFLEFHKMPICEMGCKNLSS
jgi:hypothetical protein